MKFRVVAEIESEEDLIRIRDQVEIEVYLTADKRKAKIETTNWYVEKIK